MWRCYRTLRYFRARDDRNVDYWDAAARIYPMGTICTNADKQEFESLFSIIKHPSIQLSKDMVVLDVGCGIGRSTPYVAPRVSKYIGVDYSKNMIQKARKRHKDIVNASFIQNDGWSLAGVMSDSVDVAYSELVLQHMSKENTVAYIAEVLRVLKPDGVFIAQIPRLDYYTTIAPDAAVYGMTAKETKQAFKHYTFSQFLDFEVQYAYYLMRAVK